MLEKLCREPLIHFLLTAGLVFLVFEWSGGQPSSKNPDFIIGTEQLTALRISWVGNWSREPNEQEFQNLIASTIRDEMYYREGLRLGLDLDDAVVRNRMIQKIRFLQNEGEQDPSQADLNGWLTENASKYRVPAKYNFEQVYLGRELSLQEVVELRNKLNSESISQSDVALPLSVASNFEALELSDISQKFGTRFSDSIVNQTLGSWGGPVYSGFGTHLLKISAVENDRAGKLSDSAIRKQVENDWRVDQQQGMELAYIETLRKRYRPRIEGQ